ncbi:MAG TPA: hypothetical protein GX723_13150 [Thermoanaerobacterales bacterium]|nr:hypothetical protein [Thermoanaerobacterales bacterium]
MVESGISGGWVSLDNKAIIDKDLIYPGYNLEIKSAEKGSIRNKPFDEITVRDGVTITTRKLDPEEEDPDYLEGVSAGNSGKIYLEAERVNIGKGVRILAHAINNPGDEFTAGNITIRSEAVGGTDFVDMLPGVDIDHPQAIINIGEGAIIKGKDVIFEAEAKSEDIFHDSNENDLTDTKELQWLHDLLNTGVGKTLGFVEDFSLVGGVTISKATSLISINAGSLIEAESFEALSSSYISASVAPIAIAAGVAVGVGISDAQVIVEGTIITAGDCNLKSLADNTLQVAGTSGGIKGLSAGVAVSYLDSTSKVHVGGSSGASTLQVGGNLTVKAETIDRNFTFARSMTDENGKVGIAVAVSYEHGVTEAYLAGTVDVDGDILVGAYTTKEKLGDRKLVILPTVNDGVYAYAGANTSSTGDLSDDVKAKITGKISEFAKNHIKEFINKYILDKKDEIEEKSGSTITPFELAAAIAVYLDTNNATARISPKAVVTTRGSVTVHARTESQPIVVATGSVEQPKGSQNPGGEGTSGEGGAAPDPGSGGDPGTEEGTKFAGVAAVVVGIFENNVTSYIGANAEVNAAKDLNIKAEYINDYVFRYGIELIKYLIGDFYSTDDKEQTINRGDIVEVKDGHTASGEAGNLYKYIGFDPLTNVDLSTINYTNTDLWEDLGAWWKYQSIEFIRHLTTYLDNRLGTTDNLVNFWVQSNAAGADVGTCGSVSVILRDNSVEAYIDEGAKINQINDSNPGNPIYRTGKQNVKVMSVLVDEIVYFSGNIELPGIELDTKKKYNIALHLGGQGTDAPVALGGSVIVFIQNNMAKAEIRDQVHLYADNLDVIADTKVLNVIVSAAGGNAGKFGLEGTFTWLTLNNQTIAQILNGARVDVPGKVVVKANDQTDIVNVSGVITASGNTGIGGTGGYNGLSRNTQAVIGILHDSEDSGEQTGGMPTGEEPIVRAGDVLVEAQNDGFIISVAVAGVACTEKTVPKEGNKKEAPQKGGSYGVGVSAQVVINNIRDEVLAYIRQASLHSTNLVIASHNRTRVIAVGGSAAIVTKDGTSAGLAGSFALNRIFNKTKAFIDNSNVEVTENLEIKAEAEERIIAVAASGSGTTATKSGSVAGQVSLNTIASEVVAAIFNQAEVAAKNITLIATDRTMIIAVAGALTYGGKAGIGSAVAINDIPIEVLGGKRNAVKTYIENSDVSFSGDLKQIAESNNLIIAVAAAIGDSKEGMAAAASITVNTITVDTAAYINASNIIGKNEDEKNSANIELKATDNSGIYSLAGAGTFSKSYSTVGIAVAFNLIANTVNTFVKETVLEAASLTLNSTMNAVIMNVTVAGSGADKAATYGSLSINTIVGEVLAYIAESTVTTDSKVELVALNKADIGSLAGAVGGAKNIAVGASLAANYIGGYGDAFAPYQVDAYIDNSRVVVSNGNLKLWAYSNAIIKSISAVGSFSGKNAAVNGAVSLNYINMNILVYIKDCSSPDGTVPKENKFIWANGNILLEAADNTAISVLAGNIAGSGGTGVGAAIAVVFIGSLNTDPFEQYRNYNEVIEDYEPENENSPEEDLPNNAYEYPEFDFKSLNSYSQVAAYIHNSVVESENGGISLKVTANSVIFNIAAGTAIGGKTAGVQGSVALNYLAANVTALITDSIVQAADDILLEARSLRRSDIPLTALQPDRDASDELVTEYNGNPDEPDSTFKLATIHALAGLIAGGGKAGVGVALAVNYLSVNNLAGITGSQVSTNGDIILIAESDSAIFAVSAGLAGSGKLAFAGSVSVNFIRNDIQSFIKNSTVSSSNSNTEVTDGHYPGVTVYAANTSNIFSIAGQVNFSGKEGIGAAAAYNDISNTIQAYIGDANAANDTVVTSTSYVTVTSLSQCNITTFAVGGGFGGKFSGNGSISINTIRNDIAGYILNSAVEAVQSIYLTASDKSKIGAVAGAVGISGSTAVGGSLAINFIGGFSEDALGPHQIQAYIANSKVISTNGSITLKALSEAIIKSIAAVGGFAGKVAVNGSVSINWIYTDVAAYILGCQGDEKYIQAKQDITLDAVDNSAVSVIAGDVSGGGVLGAGASIAIVFIGSGTDSLKDWFDALYKNEIFDDGEYPYDNIYDEDYVEEHEDENWDDREGVSEADYEYPEPEFADTGKVRAYISDSEVIAENGSVTVTATNNSIIFTISAGFAVGGKAGAYRGSLSLNHIHNDVLAMIINSIIDAGEDVSVSALTLQRNWIPKGALQAEWDDDTDYEQVTSFDGGQQFEEGENPVETEPTSPKRLTSIQAIAGGVSGGLNVGLGAALAVNHLHNEYSAAIVNSAINAGGDVVVLAECKSGIETVSGAIALAVGVNSFPFAAAGSLSLNMINNTILSHITASTVQAANITVMAKDTSFINSVSGQVGISGGIVAGPVPVPTGAAFGAALAYNDINSVVKAYIDNVIGEDTKKASVLTATGNTVIKALFDADINTIAAGGSLSVWVGASGTVATNIIKSLVEAYITGSNVTADNNIYILAHSDSFIGSYGGAVGGGLIGYGAAAVINAIDVTTRAYISGSVVVASGNGDGIEVFAWNDNGKPVKDGQGHGPKENGLIIIAYSRDALAIYTGSLGFGAAGLSGELSASSLKNVTEAYITSSNINNEDDWGRKVIIRAHQDTGVVIYTGAAAVGIGSVALGTALNTILVQHWTKAYIDNESIVCALEGIDVWALTGYHPLEEGKKGVIIGGAAVGTTGAIAGVVSVLMMENINEAFVKESDLFSRGTITVKSLHNVKVESVIASVAADLLFIGSGGSIFFTSLDNIVRAFVEAASLNASEAVQIIARSRDVIDLIIGTGGAGAIGGVAGSIGLTLIETITEAYLQGAINQNPRFRPGGLYQPGTEKQSILVLADNETKVKTFGGALGVGVGFGVGAALDLVSIHNRTVAMVKAATNLYARDDIEVRAKSLKIVDSQVYSGEATGLVGISGAVSIIIVGTAIDEDGKNEFNQVLQEQLDNDLSKDAFFYYNKDNQKGTRMPSIFGDRLITLISFFDDLSKIADKLGDVLDPDMEYSDRVTMAAVEKSQKEENGVEIVTDGKVIIEAINKYDIKSTPSNIAASVLAGFGGTVGLVATQERTLAYVGDYSYIRALSLNIRAESWDKTEVICKAVSGAAGIGAHAYVALAGVTPHVDAYLGHNSNIIVSKNVEINAEVIPEVVAEVKSVDVSGVGQVGGSIAGAVVKPVVNAWIGDNTYIFAATLPVTGNPTLTLLEKAELTGNPELQFRGYTIRVQGEFTFVRGVAMSGDPDLVFEGPIVVEGQFTLIRGVAMTGQPGLVFKYDKGEIRGQIYRHVYVTLTEGDNGNYNLTVWDWDFDSNGYVELNLEEKSWSEIIYL